MQVQWIWTINIGDHVSGITAVIESGSSSLTAKSVSIHNVNGFSGSYWEGNHGNAQASIVASTWTITGTVDGFNTDTAAVKPATSNFTITANC